MVWALGHTLACSRRKRDPDSLRCSSGTFASGGIFHAEDRRISQPRRPAGRPSALGGAGRSGRRAQQGRQLSADLRFRGPDLESATEAELVSTSRGSTTCSAASARAGRCSSRPSGVEALGYPESRFPDAASWLVDKERQASFEGEREHFESRYHLTLVWLPPADSAGSAERALIERSEGAGRDWREALGGFVAETDRALDLLSGFMPEVRPLDDEETLAYPPSQRIGAAAPGRRARDAGLSRRACSPTRRSTGGLEPMLGDLHLRTITVLGFPAHEPARAARRAQSLRISATAG